MLSGLVCDDHDHGPRGWIASLLPALVTAASAATAPQSLRFVVIPKVTHPWFDVVRGGAQEAAAMIQRQNGHAAAIDYRPPARSEVGLQAEILQAAIRSRPRGITIDLLDAKALRPLLEQARGQGIPLNVFDSEAPADLPLTSIASAEAQAAATMRRYPQLRGWVVSDAGGGIGVGRAVEALGKTGRVKVVALDDLPDLLQLIRSGLVDSTAATKPRSQG